MNKIIFTFLLNIRNNGLFVTPKIFDLNLLNGKEVESNDIKKDSYSYVLGNTLDNKPRSTVINNNNFSLEKVNEINPYFSSQPGSVAFNVAK